MTIKNDETTYTKYINDRQDVFLNINTVCINEKKRGEKINSLVKKKLIL
jgi:hypothetical protein